MAVKTPFGEPSDEILTGVIGDQQFAFLPRHGRGHRLSPTGINYRANIWALKSLGVRRILSVSAVGSLKEEHAPGDFVLVDQYIDQTVQRVNSFLRMAVWVMSPWRTQFVTISTNGYLKRQSNRMSQFTLVGPMWRLRVLNSPRKQSPICTVRGVAM